MQRLVVTLQTCDGSNGKASAQRVCFECEMEDGDDPTFVQRYMKPAMTALRAKLLQKTPVAIS